MCLEKYYKYVYTCKCGNQYGADFKDFPIICPECRLELKQRRRKIVTNGKEGGNQNA